MVQKWGGVTRSMRSCANFCALSTPESFASSLRFIDFLAIYCSADLSLCPNQYYASLSITFREMLSARAVAASRNGLRSFS